MLRAARFMLAAAVMAGIAGPVVLTSTAKADEVTAGENVARTGWDQNEPNLPPGVVGSSSFGQLFATSVAGQVYAQPIVVGNSVIVATEEDNVYSLNAQTGAINWQVNVGPAWPSSANGCNDLTPYIGITSTPVYDPSDGDVYLVGVTNDGPNEYQPNISLFALNASTGQQDWKVPVQGAPVNDPTNPFNTFTERQRASLLLDNGELYMSFASYCDYKPYVGIVAGVNTTSHAETMWSDESGLTDYQGGVWMSDSGIMSDGAGRIFLTSGNGTSPAVGAGTSPPQELGDSVIRLGMTSGGTLAAQDFFSPTNAPTLDSQDLDLGSAGPVALPFGTSTYPDLLAQGSKDGRLFILNRDSLGGRGATTDNDVSVSGPYAKEFGRTAAFAGANGNDFLYYLGVGDYLRALKFDTTTAALTDTFNSASKLGYGSGSPVVTSNGNDPNSAVVWVISKNATSSSLEAFDAVPSSGTTLPLLWSSPLGVAAKFTVPATDSGRVYVGTSDGKVYGFGSPDTAPLTSAPLSFGQVAVGSSSTQNVTVTANSTVTVTGVNATVADGAGVNPFSTGTPSGPGGASTFPMTLTAGQTLTVPVGFAATAPGGDTGALNFTTSTANFATVPISLSGTATKTGFYAVPSSVSFGTAPIGSVQLAQTVITNGGTQPELWNKIAPPADSAFSFYGQPPAGTEILPGQSVTLNISYAPGGTAGDSSSISEPSSLTGGTTATVSLSGTGTSGQGTLSASTSSVAFGSVALGQQASQPVSVTNTGNLPMLITGFTAPSVPFGTPVPVTTNISLAPGDQIQFPVTFTPQNLAFTSATYTLTATDGHNPAQKLQVHVSGSGVAPASGASVPSPGGGWRVNGSAQMAGTSLRLTRAVTSQTGTAVQYQSLSSNGLNAQFTTSLSGGNGGDGVTFAMLDASKTSSVAMGTGGQDLGFGGLPGVAVVVGTNPNQIGIATGATSSGLTYAATTTNVPNLRTGTHTVNVSVTGSAPSTITVSVDGTQVLTTQLTMPTKVLAAFTGATDGTYTQVQTVSAVSIGSGSIQLPPPGGGWSYNGAATMYGADTRLNSAVANQTGAVVYPVPVSTDGLKATFNMQVGGGTGADGMTFSLLDPADGTTALGGGAGSLGFGGLSGVAAAFDTNKVTGYPSSNFTGIATGQVMAGELKFDSTVSAIAPLRTGTHTVTVTVTGSVLTVYLDGVVALQRTETIPAQALLAFTGADDTLTDIHTVRNAAISVP